MPSSKNRFPVFIFLQSYYIPQIRKYQRVFRFYFFKLLLTLQSIRSMWRSPVIADLFHRMKYMERRGSGLRRIVSETEKLPGYTAAYNPEFSSTATDFRVILKNVNYNLESDTHQVTHQDSTLSAVSTQKRCVAIFAAVAAAHIRIYRIIAHRQIGYCEDAFYFNVSDDWFHCMYAPLILLISHEAGSSYPSYRQNRSFDTAACLCLRFQDKFLKYAVDEPALQAT